MINRSEILQTIAMIDQQHLDIRTITMGISLLDCADTDIARSCTKVYDKICRLAGRLVRTGEDIEAEFGIPIVNKRVSVTPISLVAAGSGAQSYVPYAQALDRAAHEIGVNFLGGFSALVQKGMTDSDRVLIASIPEALAGTELVCASVNVGSTRAGINMDAVAEMGRTVKRAAALTAAQGGMACAKLVVFANAVEDNPFMAGAFHGVGEPECEVHVGVSGPGVVQHALRSVHGQPFDVVAETVKRRPSASRAWVSSWRRRHPRGWACRSASWTCRSHRRPPSVTAWPPCSRRWGWNPSVHPARRRRSRCSTTR